MKRHIPESHGSHPNVTPLIDVIMVLIVFFMLVAKIGVSTGADQKISIPKTVLGSDIKDMGNTLLLNVAPITPDSDDPIITALISSNNSQPTIQELKLRDGQGQNQLVNTLKFYRFGKDLKKGGTGENADNDSFQVVIRGDKEMHYAALQPVLEACAEANVKAVNFNTGTEQVAAP